MPTLPQLEREERDHARQLEARRKRIDALIAEILALPYEDARTTIVQASRALEQVAAHATTSPARVDRRQETYVAKAEAAVLAAPEGLTGPQVAQMIGQEAKGVNSTLAQAEKRGKIERRGKLWLPSDAPRVPNRKRGKSLADFILDVFAATNKPHSTNDLYEAIRKRLPDVNKESVGVAVSRMNKQRVLTQVGNGANNGGIYAVVNGGATATTST